MPSPSGYVLNPIEVGGAVVAAQPVPRTPDYENLLADVSFNLPRFGPRGSIAELFPRYLASVNGSVLSTGRLSTQLIFLQKGMRISSATFLSATTALGTGTHQWFSLHTEGGTLLGQTANDTSTAWAANSYKTLAFTSSILIPSTGWYYLGINVTATTVPTLHSYTGSTVNSGAVPILQGTANTGLTDTAPATLGTITAVAARPYAYVS